VPPVEWRSYSSVPLGSPTQEIEAVLIHCPDVDASGAEEIATTVVAAAVGNTVFDAHGAHLRRVSFQAERVKAVLDSRAG